MSGIGQCRWLVARSWGERRGWRGTLDGFPLRVMILFDNDCGHSGVTLNIHKTAELYTLTRGTTSYVNYMSIRLFFKNELNFCQPQGFIAQSGKGCHQRGLCAVTWPMSCVTCGCIPIRAPSAFERISQAGMEWPLLHHKTIQNLKAGGRFLHVVCTRTTAALTNLKGDQKHRWALESF